MNKNSIADNISRNELQKVEQYRKKQNTSVLVVLFTDLQDSTSLREELGDIDFTKLLKEHDEVVKPLISDYNGEFIKGTGDGVLAVFSEPSSAVKYSLELQKKFHRHRDIKIKIGMDMGQVSREVSEDVNVDVFGRFVNRAARVVSLAKGGHILVTESIQDSASGWIDSSLISWKSQGEHNVKGVKKTLKIWEPYNANMASPMEFQKKQKTPPNTAETAPKITTPGPKMKRGMPLWVIAAIAVVCIVIVYVIVSIVNEPISEEVFEAVEKGDVKRMQTLIKRGADVNVRTEDKEGDTPLILAIDKGNAQMVKLLLQNGARVDMTEKSQNNTPLLIAVDRKRPEAVKMLLLHDADPNLFNVEKTTPLHLAVLHRSIETARQLVEHGADLNCRDINGFAPLHVAARDNYNNILSDLIQKGANVDVKNEAGDTPLHLAIQNGNKAAAETLLIKDADYNLKNKAGQTPLDVAQKKSLSEMIQLLKSYGARD